ncbi:MAG TPA: MFS transporter [Candidatus Peribacteraceae bacterium]|nr:MFS transporter [Candidatus Peribacteraceae bacterium]
MRTHDPYKALRSRNYAFFLLGNVLDSIGNQMQVVAVGWELYLRTHSAAVLGFAGLVQFIPVLLLALPVGHAADRYNRKTMVLIAEIITAIAAGGLAVFSALHVAFYFYYSCVFLLGVSLSINMTSRSSLLPSLVPKDALTNAITWNSNGRQVATMAGPAIGGLIIAITGGSFWVYVIDALSSLAFILLLLPLKIPYQKPQQREKISLHSLLVGARFIWETPLILATITLDLFAVLLGGATSLLPIYATDILHVGAQGLGWLRAAPSVGSMIMAVAIAHLPAMRRAGPTLLLAVGGFGIATILFGLSKNFYLSIAMLILTGAFDTISVVIRSSLVQIRTPNHMLGRVSAINSVFIGSSNQLGEFESGTVAQFFGAVASAVSGGIGTIIVVASVALIWPQVRQLTTLDQAAETTKS